MKNITGIRRNGRIYSGAVKEDGKKKMDEEIMNL